MDSSLLVRSWESGDRDEWSVFLDQLEENHPNVRALFVPGGDIAQCLMGLGKCFPDEKIVWKNVDRNAFGLLQSEENVNVLSNKFGVEKFDVWCRDCSNEIVNITAHGCEVSCHQEPFKRLCIDEFKAPTRSRDWCMGNLGSLTQGSLVFPVERVDVECDVNEMFLLPRSHSKLSPMSLDMSNPIFKHALHNLRMVWRTTVQSFVDFESFLGIATTERIERLRESEPLKGLLPR